MRKDGKIFVGTGRGEDSELVRGRRGGRMNGERDLRRRKYELRK
jgi:hypothetical protein